MTSMSLKDVKHKVFIEYGHAEEAWAPIDASGYMLINCFWVAGSYKGQGYGKKLLKECLKDSKDKNGVVVI
jgi:ribosomal protein S18 acetylase RimI-like enzyme